MNEIKSLKDLYFIINQREGGKSEVIRADVIEMIRILSDLTVTNPEVWDLLQKNGKRRSKKNPIKKKKLKAA